MAMTDAIVRYRRFLKRRNVSPNTVKNYLSSLKHFVVWIDVRLEEVTHRKIMAYVDHLLGKRLRPKTINCYLNSICQFYHYLSEEEGIPMVNPVRKASIMKLPRSLPRHLKEEQLGLFFKEVKGYRDQALFTLMLRCGLRVEEVAHLSLGHIDLKRQNPAHPGWQGRQGSNGLSQPGCLAGPGGIPAESEDPARRSRKSSWWRKDR